MQTPVIERNGTSKTLTEMVFGKKSDNAGKKFYAPVVDITNESDLTWVGVDNINMSLNKNLRTIFAGILLDNINDAGEFNEAQYLLDCADFTAGIDKLSDIEADLEDLYAQQNEIINHADFGATVDGTEDGAKTPEAIELEQKMKELAAKVRPLKVKKASIEAKYKERADKRKAKEEKKKAEAAKQPQVAETVNA